MIRWRGVGWVWVLGSKFAGCRSIGCEFGYGVGLNRVMAPSTKKKVAVGVGTGEY